MHPRTTQAAIAAATLIAGSAISAASAQQFFFDAVIDGSQEVPAVDTPATGTLTGVYDTMANTFSFSWSITDNLIGMPASPGAHIHMAPAGSNGPVIFDFANPDGTWPLEGMATWSNLSEMQVDALFNGGLYVNFHTTTFPPGEVRGQITLIPTPGPAAFAVLGLGAALTRRRR